jgi:hypothetical protein
MGANGGYVNRDGVLELQERIAVLFEYSELYDLYLA